MPDPAKLELMPGMMRSIVFCTSWSVYCDLTFGSIARVKAPCAALALPKAPPATPPAAL
mgnify:CR=1 FL=1